MAGIEYYWDEDREGNLIRVPMPRGWARVRKFVLENHDAMIYVRDPWKWYGWQGWHTGLWRWDGHWPYSDEEILANIHAVYPGAPTSIVRADVTQPGARDIEPGVLYYRVPPHGAFDYWTVVCKRGDWVNHPAIPRPLPSTDIPPKALRPSCALRERHHYVWHRLKHYDRDAVADALARAFPSLNVCREWLNTSPFRNLSATGDCIYVNGSADSGITTVPHCFVSWNYRTGRPDRGKAETPVAK